MMRDAPNKKCAGGGAERAFDDSRGLCLPCLRKAGLGGAAENTPTINRETGPAGTLVRPVPASGQRQEALNSQRNSTARQTLDMFLAHWF
jgi:hypothetical protein